jgi:RHS repeat-associated protein
MTYDAAGNLETRTDFMNRVTTYAYDDNNRLLSRTYPNPDENVSFTYTPTGRRLTATYNGETTAYEYDTRDRLTKVTHPDGRELQYEHDAQGNRLKLTAILTGLSLVSSYTFDPLNRLEDVTDPAERVYTHGYDENGNRASLVHPNGVETAYTYDTLNRLTNLATTHPGLLRTIQTYAFTLGPAGNRTRIVEAAGLPQERTLDYGYDDLYRLTGETVTESLGIVYTKTFGYDPVGNRLSQTTTIGPAGSPGPVLQDGTLSYGYDTRDRLLTEQLDALPATGYGWDDNGNLTTKDAEATYTWDHENRLVRVSKTDGTVVEHVYDPDGNRVQTSVTPPAAPATTTDFLVDTSGALSHVVAETADTGALKTYYVRGDDLLAVMRPLVTVPAAPEDWQTRYSHADGLGSIRRLTDEGANITDGYTYTAFGELLAHTGTDPQPYAFTGEPLDPNSGWQYHRARWMDPRVGRFAGVDPWEGMEHDPVSLHRYLYAEMNPVGSSDPSGRYTLTQLTIAGGIIGALAGASAYTLTRDSAEEFTWTGFGKWTLGGAILGAAIGAGVYYGPVISVRWAGAAPGVLKTWQQAEKFLGRTLGMTKNTIDLLINGRIRIPDFLDHARRFVGESKFVQELYLTGRVGQQLRDYADYCRLNGYRMYVFVRHDTKIGAKVVQLVEQTGGSIVRMFVQD